MKKITFFVLMLFIFILASCQEQEIECDDNEELVDGVCEIIKTPFEQTFDRMAVLDNYTLEVSIQQLADIYTITMEIDQQKATFEIDGVKEYYVNQNGVCTHYFPIDEGYRSETISCGESDASYDFFHAFEPSWFMEVSGKYFLKTEFYDEVSSLFQTEIEGSSIANLELVLGETYFDEIIFDVFVGEISYRFEMSFVHVGSTVIDLPTV